MLLAVDIGNSNIVLGGMREQEICFISRLKTDAGQTADQYAVELWGILALYGLTQKDIDRAIISSVVPQLNDSFCDAVRHACGVEPLLVGPGVKTGLNIRIDNPAQLGADMVVAAVGALSRYPLPLILIDLGTATTFSVLDASGTFLGGSILPGVVISLEALTSRAAQLPGISLTAPKRAIGTNTVDCMRSGVLLGHASMLDGMIDRMEQELGEETTVVATGGLAPLIVSHCRHTITCDNDLMLYGLWLIDHKNR